MIEKWLVVVSIFFSFAFPISAQTANPNSNETTKKIFNYLSSLAEKNSKKIISGQELNSAFKPEASFDSSAGKIYASSGKWVGLIGINYQRTAVGYPSELKACNDVLVDYFQTGGLVSVMCSFSNPWNTTGNANDTTNRYKLSELTTPGTAAYQKIHIQLDSLAQGLQDLKTAGVTVLLRLFHENNATWFWWGSRTSTKPTWEEWTSMWIHCFNYLTVEKNLNNLLWVFSPSAKESNIANPAFKGDDFYYPGNNYVDIIGVDVYSDTLDIPLYNKLKTYGKPFALCEFGMSRQSASKMKNYDYRILIDQIKKKYPEIVYWMSWNDFTNQQGATYYGMTYQNNVSQLLNDDWVINRNDINWNMTEVSSVELPDGYKLDQNYPNPFNPTTKINYSIPVDSRGQPVSTILKVYDMFGREVAILVNDKKYSGNYEITFDGNGLASGVYFYKLQAAEYLSTKKMILLK